MGNACSESYNAKSGSRMPELHIQDFKKTYKFLKFPKTLSFTNDSTIFRLRHRSTEEVYVVKRVTFSNEKDLSLFICQLDQIILMEHDNLLKIYHYAVEKNQLKDFDICFTLNIVLEHFDYTLQDEITWRTKVNRTFKESQIRNMLTSMVDVLEFLQLKNISLGNLKPSNIYITSSKQPKLMYLGDLPCPPNSDQQSQSLSHLKYMSPQLRFKFAEAFFPEKMSTVTPPSGESTPTPKVNSAYKSDVFSLGLILLEMMSMKSISGLNAPDCGNMRQYRVIQCDKEFDYTVRNAVETMLKENEAGRPDFLDLKKLLVMGECAEFTKSVNKENQPGRKEVLKTNIEMKTIKNRSEFRLPAKYFIEPSEYSDGSFCDLSPTKASTDPLNEGSETFNGKKGKSEDILEDGERKENELDEYFIEKEKDVINAYNQKIMRLRKLGISFEEKQLSKETISLLSEVISWQSGLEELVIAMPKTKLGDEGLGILSQGIEKNTEVVKCYFDFRKTRITDNGLKGFGKCLLDKPRLAQLGLNFSDNSITSQGCEEIAGWFDNIGSVKSLAINIGGNRIKNEGIAAIGRCFKKMEQLETIMIFAHTNEIEGNEMKSFFEELKGVKKLKKLNLDLTSNLLEDEEMEIIERFLMESEVQDVNINLKDNCISEEVRRELKKRLTGKENVNVMF